MSSLDSTQTFPLEILHASNAFPYSDCSEIVRNATNISTTLHLRKDRIVKQSVA